MLQKLIKYFIRSLLSPSTILNFRECPNYKQSYLHQRNNSLGGNKYTSLLFEPNPKEKWWQVSKMLPNSLKQVVFVIEKLCLVLWTTLVKITKELENYLIKDLSLARSTVSFLVRSIQKCVGFWIHVRFLFRLIQSLRKYGP